MVNYRLEIDSKVILVNCEILGVVREYDLVEYYIRFYHPVDCIQYQKWVQSQQLTFEEAN